MAMEDISLEYNKRLKSKWLLKEMCGFPAMPAPRRKRILQGPFVPPPKPESSVEGIDNVHPQAVNLHGSSLKDVTNIAGKKSGLEESTIKQALEEHTQKIAINTSTLIDNSKRECNGLKVNEQVDVETEPLFALLNNSVSPLANLDDAQKLTWLRSQLIGEDQEFSTPFGKRVLLYADHTASGKSLFFIENFITKHLLPFYGNTHTDDSYVGRRTSRIMRHAEEYIKERMGGSQEDALLMCGWGCTAAIKRLQEVMGIAVPSILRGHVLNMMQMQTADQERWLVFVGPYEHHSNLLSWRQSLAEVREIPANEEGLIDMERLEAELEVAEAAGRRRKLGAFSACSNVTGLLTNTRAVARLLHKYGAFACFDFAAGAPHLQIDIRSGQEDGFDAVVMSPHKFLGGPGTPGLLLMSKNLYMLKKQPPSTCGGGTVAYVNGFNEKDTLYYEALEEREEGGTPPIVGKVRCALAFWLKEAMGIPLIILREALYLNKAMKRLYAHPSIQLLGGQPHNRVPILSFVINTQVGSMPAAASSEQNTHLFGKPLHGRFVVKLLNDLFGIQARGGCACAGPYGHFLLGVNKELSLAIRHAIQMGYEGLKPGWARLGLCYSMTEEEVDYILSAIEFMADHGHRFLSLYDFDWRSGNWTYNGHPDIQKSIQALVELPENDMSRSRRLGLRKYLRRAKALSQLLPKRPLPKPIPHDVDPKLLLFSL